MPKYKIIYADPAWQYADKSKHRGGAARHYETMTIADLWDMNVASICDDDCILFLWVTFPMLQEAFPLMEAWGFKYKTLGFNWVKRNKKADSFFWGMGNWTRSNPEICLIGVRGNPQRVGKGVHSIIDSRIERHSQKPAETRSKIVALCGDVPRLELFARERSPGWDVFGDQVEGSIIMPSGSGFKPIVILESPYAGNVGLNIIYARAAMADSLQRGEAPYASHLLYTQDGVLDDDKPEERRLGMEAGFAFGRAASKVVVYTDLGISSGMKAGIKAHRKKGLKIEKRKIGFINGRI